MSFKKEYRNLEMKVLRTINEMIQNSNSKSQHINDCKCVVTDVCGYTEVVMVNDQIVLLNRDGEHTPALSSCCTLEDLIDIIES